MKILYTLLFLGLTGCILTNSQLSLSYAFIGLKLWFEKMIPALLPFMILSGIMVRMRLTEGFAAALYPVLHPVYRVRKNVCYAMIMGFFCGFPMGARVTADLLAENLIDKREAEFLLSFCNNIGPVYFCSFVLPLLHRRLLWPYLFGMYGIPLLYGLVMRYTMFRGLGQQGNDSKLPLEKGALAAQNAVSLTACEIPARQKSGGLLAKIDEAIAASIQNILSLGGYMILFNLLHLVPHIILGKPFLYAAPLFEITGGLSMLGDALPLYSLLLLPFGGFCCIAQTYSCIKNKGISIADYTFHKLALMACTALFYFLWAVLFPDSFLL